MRIALELTKERPQNSMAPRTARVGRSGCCVFCLESMLRSSKRYHNRGGPVKQKPVAPAQSEGARQQVPVPLCPFFSYIDSRSTIKVSRILEEIEIRRVRRALSEKPVPGDALARNMTAATYAPSCFNNQPWRFLVINRDRELEHSLRDRKPEDQAIMYNRWAEERVEE